MVIYRFNDFEADTELYELRRQGEAQPVEPQVFDLLCFLIEQRGRRRFLSFVEDGIESDDWSGAVKRHYQYADLSELKVAWTEHVAGRRHTE